MTVDEAIRWIAELFEEPNGNLRLETPRSEIVAWDSLGVLTLMARLDEDFDILLTEEQLQNLRSVQDVIAAMRDHGAIV